MKLLCRLGWHRWKQFLLPSLPDGSVWPGQLQRKCERCPRHEACYPSHATTFLWNGDWVRIDMPTAANAETEEGR